MSMMLCCNGICKLQTLFLNEENVAQMHVSFVGFGQRNSSSAIFLKPWRHIQFCYLVGSFRFPAISALGLDLQNFVRPISCIPSCFTSAFWSVKFQFPSVKPFALPAREFREMSLPGAISVSHPERWKLTKPLARSAVLTWAMAQPLRMTPRVLELVVPTSLTNGYGTSATSRYKWLVSIYFLVGEYQLSILDGEPPVTTLGFRTARASGIGNSMAGVLVWFCSGFRAWQLNDANPRTSGIETQAGCWELEPMCWQCNW